MHRGELEGVFHDGTQLLFIGSKAAARAAEGERRAQHHRVADGLRRCHALFHGMGDERGQHRLAQFLAQLLEKLAVLGALDGSAVRAQEFHLALAQHALTLQLHGEVEARLPADAGHDGVRALVAENFGQILQLQRLHVHLVGNGGVGHDGGGVGVDQHHLVALFLEGEACLRARVVKFRGLTDDDGAGADDEYFVDVCALRHGFPPPS